MRRKTYCRIGDAIVLVPAAVLMLILEWYNTPGRLLIVILVAGGMSLLAVPFWLKGGDD